MPMRQRPVLTAFAVLSAAHLLGEIAGWPGVSLFTKPLLMPALALWFWLETRPFASVSTRKLVAGSLLLSWLGDCLLLLEKHSSAAPFFLLGLGAFLAAHLCYLAAFVKFPAAKPSLLKKNSWLLLLFAVYLLAMDSFLWPSLPSGLRGPVVVYSLAITAMAVGAASLFGKIDGRTARLVFLGALFFVASDSLLAVSKFHSPIPGAGFWVMATYLLGQFGIAVGVWRGLPGKS